MATSLEATTPPASSARSQRLDKSTIRLAPRIKAALRVLLESLEYVQDLDCGIWDFAVELSALRRLKLSNSDLRWLIARGLMEHAIEVTLAGDAERSFRRTPRPLFCKKTCFALTSDGAVFARGNGVRVDPPASGGGRKTPERSWSSLAPQPDALVPKWDRDRQELKVGSIVAKRFKVPAPNQEAILAAFEEEGWPPRIDDPLPPHREQSPKRRLQETIKSLNRNQKKRMIRFLGDGSGQGVRWEFSNRSDPALDG